MFTIGLTGGIGSGKSTVAKMFADAGFPVVDADQVARDNMAPGSPVLAEVARVFGEDLIGAGGELDRAELARRAFASEEQTRKLNEITHPAIRRESDRRFAQLEQRGVKAAVYDMPLLVELGLNEEMDLTVVVDVAAEERVRRLVEHRGLDEGDARNRIARQAGDEERRARADIVIDNNGSLEELRARVEGVVDKIEKML
ncbi:dephospho-CoA kinase [Corynebacterium liangguodongii]|uniref:Dephospho-CoA kinase n=1 Tax=Corynebacterium liangguodongii TaxID=2079535 RepID=A0A2S0WDV2_9CORY|nr:dephospho-CoA kinase [Corynebacterium liangguodongii]AWB83930.1 dephospho-CoA kinase [Corynebacterium liangguodongii]PWB99069.1 dephospho-CoA kinase [Corynebacterium liangguodongii]